MKVAVTGGGTAGHVTPLLAVASEIKKSDANVDVRYFGKRNDPMNDIVRKDHNINKLYTVNAGKLRRFNGKSFKWYFTQPKLVLQNIRDIVLLLVGTFESLFKMIFWRPDVLFVKGGYVGLPVGLAAVILRIPIITHDSDAYPGLTNRVLSRFATKLAVGWPIEHYTAYPKSKLVYCGIPVSDDYLNPKDRKKVRQDLGIDPEQKVVAVVGGSLGAVRLNEAILKQIKEITSSYYLFWVCGRYHYKELQELLETNKYKSNISLLSFTNEMANILNSADVVVARAGATSLAELSELAKPTIIVPNPLLTGGHQLKNAKVYNEKQAAEVVSEEDLLNNPGKITKSIISILENPEKSKTLSENIKLFAEPRAAHNIAALIMNIAVRE